MGKHPLQNRVTPFSEIVAVQERGTFMGNRGSLHNAQKELTRRKWTTLRWITCVLEFKGRHREVMHPGYYTELFFLDEATAFAAGHRPCAECRRADYNRFMELWREVYGESRRVRADDADAVLHAERMTEEKVQRRWAARLGDLPDGTFVATKDAAQRALLWHRDWLWEWSPGGYGEGPAVSRETEVDVLTPPSIVKILAAGYSPVVHSTADAVTRSRRGAPLARDRAADSHGSTGAGRSPHERLTRAVIDNRVEPR